MSHMILYNIACYTTFFLFCNSKHFWPMKKCLIIHCHKPCPARGFVWSVCSMYICVVSNFKCILPNCANIRHLSELIWILWHFCKRSLHRWSLYSLCRYFLCPLGFKLPPFNSIASLVPLCFILDLSSSSLLIRSAILERIMWWGPSFIPGELYFKYSSISWEAKANPWQFRWLHLLFFSINAFH